MPPITNSPHKTGKSLLFFTFEIPLFSVMSINSQIYMTKPKQARKTLSENTGKTVSVIMPPFSSKGGGHNYGNDCTMVFYDIQNWIEHCSWVYECHFHR